MFLCFTTNNTNVIFKITSLLIDLFLYFSYFHNIGAVVNKRENERKEIRFMTSQCVMMSSSELKVTNGLPLSHTLQFSLYLFMEGSLSIFFNLLVDLLLLFLKIFY